MHQTQYFTHVYVTFIQRYHAFTHCTVLIFNDFMLQYYKINKMNRQTSTIDFHCCCKKNEIVSSSPLQNSLGTPAYIRVCCNFYFSRVSQLEDLIWQILEILILLFIFQFRVVFQLGT